MSDFLTDGMEEESQNRGPIKSITLTTGFIVGDIQSVAYANKIRDLLHLRWNKRKSSDSRSLNA